MIRSLFSLPLEATSEIDWNEREGQFTPVGQRRERERTKIELVNRFDNRNGDQTKERKTLPHEHTRIDNYLREVGEESDARSSPLETEFPDGGSLLIFPCTLPSPFVRAVSIDSKLSRSTLELGERRIHSRVKSIVSLHVEVY